MPSRVIVAGPSAWNHLILLDRLPEPVPHMQFAEREWHALGGTSAGKALHLASLDVDVRLRTPLGADTDGDRVADALVLGRVVVDRVPSERTERHVNLMTVAGERVSIYVSTPSPPAEEDVAAAAAAVADAEIAVIDLSDLGAALLGRCGEVPLWVDLHDYDGSAAFHEPFVRAADVVFMNDDKTDDPWALMESCLRRGPRLAVCTRGAEGAVALTSSGTRHGVEATAAHVVDTNGAGDAFMAGFLAATLSGACVDSALSAGANQARIAIESPHMHPVLSVEAASHS
ncbi:carbohydrate kinase family protein [Microbacterium amylolyticum]|uniref:Sugar/nucleoside kinase (Ribokinase family) n=1 Tax=Microbacterium amylolyticum TaxID=936337 RepID=A0ABS4ZG90_9MICO|nr:carbohydrate kinase family protein [Microbacterium amylolyticum]MBP2436295.1 sugar/nucleoside kinase (ribokinase family) [Microbacterium amylolyticum]